VTRGEGGRISIQSPDQPDYRRRLGEVLSQPGVLEIILLATVFIVYSGTLAFGFVYDDHPVFVENPLVHAWRYVPSYFSTYFGSQLAGANATYYRPVFLLWFRLIHSLAGLHPALWHLSTVLVHVAVTYLVFLLAWRLTGDRWTAWIAALLYGLHPVHVESVAWISGVADPLLALFFLSALLAYLKHRQRGASAAWLAASLLLYAMALLQKEVAIVLPAVVFMYVVLFVPEDKGWGPKLRSAVVGALPFLAVTALYLVVRSWALHGMVRTIAPISVKTMILTWPSLLWFYLKLLVYPAGLSPFYDAGYVTKLGLRDFVLPLAGVLAAAALLWFWARRSPAQARTIAFACAFLVLPLMPALYIRVFNYGDYAHDRYLYLPSVGFVILCALAIRQLPHAKLQAALVAAIAALLLAGTITQQLNWASDLLLYTRGTSIAPSNLVARNNLGNALLERGRYPDAVAVYQQVLKQDPNFWMATYNLGYVSYRLHKFDDAEQYLSRAIVLNPNDADEYFVRGASRVESGHVDAGIADLKRAVQMRPDAEPYRAMLRQAIERQPQK